MPLQQQQQQQLPSSSAGRQGGRGDHANTKNRRCLQRWRYINLILSAGLLVFCTTSFFLCLHIDSGNNGTLQQQQPICRLWTRSSATYPVIRPPPPPSDPSPPMPKCPDYTEYAKQFHGPGSDGPLNLPFQRPIEACRKFASHVIDSAIESISSKMADADLARLFTNSFPNTLDTTVRATECVKNTTNCNGPPLSFIITGDIDAMWLRDSANQLLPYIEFVNQDVSLKRLFLGLIHMQAQFVHLAPYANAFTEPSALGQGGGHEVHKRATDSGRDIPNGVHEQKWEVDSLSSFLGFSYRYWNMTGDDSFVHSESWVDAVNDVLRTVQEQQEPTFDPKTGEPTTPHYKFTQNTDRPTETQFNQGIGNAVQRTGLVKSLFRPSDDATVFPFFIPGNAQLSVELAHISQMLSQIHGNSNGQHVVKPTAGIQEKLKTIADDAGRLSHEIRDAIYKYAVVDVPGFDKVFAYEVDGYGSRFIMDDANVPSLLSLPMLEFIASDDPIYQNTRRLVLSRANPYYFEGPRGSGIGGPHVGLDYAWPMSQIVRILTSSDDKEIKDALDVILHSTDHTGLIHESFNVYGNQDPKYTRPWFAWANGLFGEAILKIVKERPHLIFKQ